VTERDLAGVVVGQGALVSVPGVAEGISGTISLVAANIDPVTRTADVRVVVPNKEGKLRTNSFVNVALEVPVSEPDVLVVPDSAVLDDGIKQVVIVADEVGKFTPRKVEVGARAGGFTEIKDGVMVGENVVVQANFLIDAESNLKAVLQGMEGASATTVRQ
jgi:Cu(I)/Ag(I) efflux system membrane fusion protein